MAWLLELGAVTRRAKPKPTLVEHLAAMDRAELEVAAAAFVKFTFFALGFLQAGRGGGLSYDRETGKIQNWKEDAYDALELAGVWERKKPRKVAKR